MADCEGKAEIVAVPALTGVAAGCGFGLTDVFASWTDVVAR
jgi:hypothetical protein